jgi:hypothetical protein
MIFVFIIRFITAAAITMVAINIFSPMIYRMWFEELRPTVTQERLLAAGDVFFGNFLILSWVVLGIIIMWGLVVAQRKRVQSRFEEV